MTYSKEIATKVLQTSYKGKGINTTFDIHIILKGVKNE
jgi:hypothetical protein